MRTLTAVFQNVVTAGVSPDTPTSAIDRIVYSNLLCVFGSAFNLIFVVYNASNGYGYLLVMNALYQTAMNFCLVLNFRRYFLAARLVLATSLHLGLFISGLIQGPENEIEYFFLALAVSSLSLFCGEERKYAWIFLIAALSAFVYLATRNGPVLGIDRHAGQYSFQDLLANRVGYLSLLFLNIVVLAKAFDRALRIIEFQRQKMHEEGKLAFLGTMARNVAHEINWPLTALDLQLFQLDMHLKRGVVGEAEVRDRVDRMGKISRRIAVIVRGLRFLSRPDENDPRVLQSVRNLVQSAWDLNRERIEKYKIDFRLNLKDADDAILCRPVSLSQVFFNLIHNSADALKGCPEGQRWIEVREESNDDFLRLRFSDAGKITSQEVRDSLFTAFFTTKPREKGSGLGLMISRETVEAHGGTLEFDPQATHTTFIVEIPRFREVSSRDP